MDLGMPELDGLEATRILAADANAPKIVILTGADDDEKLFEAIKSGAQGYLLKNLDAEEFFTLLERVASGEPGLTPAVARKLLKEFARPSKSEANHDPDALTEREREVLELLVQGVTTNRNLAKTLSVSENTVKFHVRNILDKLHLNNRAQVVSFALRNRLVSVPPPGKI
jgi:DNA-binding NarL/FixJ family response regulator